MVMSDYIKGGWSFMKCTECGYEAGVSKFRYLYNARIDASISMRQCPKCQTWLAVNELKELATQKVTPGEAPWGKSAGIEGLAEDVRT
jgi:Zn-finger nucleic acid-binding protein